ncbi:hypothetical protein C8R45DRAFT_924012 [Mycena sanguinolenta]|nr:hypothetical protein C8R45DRAFT_924012 [Mycena sanguinolenta]
MTHRHSQASQYRPHHSSCSSMRRRHLIAELSGQVRPSMVADWRSWRKSVSPPQPPRPRPRPATLYLEPQPTQHPPPLGLRAPPFLILPLDDDDDDAATPHGSGDLNVPTSISVHRQFCTPPDLRASLRSNPCDESTMAITTATAYHHRFPPRWPDAPPRHFRHQHSTFESFQSRLKLHNAFFFFDLLFTLNALKSPMHHLAETTISSNGSREGMRVYTRREAPIFVLLVLDRSRAGLGALWLNQLPISVRRRHLPARAFRSHSFKYEDDLLQHGAHELELESSFTYLRATNLAHYDKASPLPLYGHFRNISTFESTKSHLQSFMIPTVQRQKLCLRSLDFSLGLHEPCALRAPLKVPSSSAS